MPVLCCKEVVRPDSEIPHGPQRDVKAVSNLLGLPQILKYLESIVLGALLALPQSLNCSCKEF